MSLELMRRRFLHYGGVARQDRMIKTKQNSLEYSIFNSYQSAKMVEYPALERVTLGLINPVVQNENYDTKLISVSRDSGYRVGTIFRWENTNTFWLIYLEDRTELAYLRGNIRRCDYKVQWVDKDRKIRETPIAVIGPSTPSLRTSSSMQAKAAQDFPNELTIIMMPDNEQNRAYFQRYQRFVLKGTTYIVETIDDLSMPGIIKLHATEHYTNKIEDDVEENLANRWNVLPIIPKTDTDKKISGPSIIKPGFKTKFTAEEEGGTWSILENTGKNLALPVKFYGATNKKVVYVYWDLMTRGNFTLVYTTASGEKYMKNIHVESLL